MFDNISLFLENPQLLVAFVIAFVIAVSFHEFAHAWTADRLGDSTPSYQGRLTLDPRVHLDPIGTLLVFVIGFGWGRPVQFNPWNLKNPMRDAALISIAGPLMNFGLAILFALIYKVAPAEARGLFAVIVQLNIMLGVFNLVPIAPLDGFKVVAGLLPKSLSYQWLSLERYSMIFLLVLFLTPIGRVLGGIISPITQVLLTI